jgi:hypothetical protein
MSNMRIVLARPFEQARWQQQNSAQQFKYAGDRDANQSEWQQKQPDEWVKNKRQYRERPADHEQN